MTTTLEECNALVTEFWVAYSVMAQPGQEFTGAALLRYRELPREQRDYFGFLTAPIIDLHAVTRTQSVSEPDAAGQRTVTYDPPIPPPCTCKSRLFLSQRLMGARCSRCLRSWPLHECQVRRDALNAALLTQPLIESVERDDMAHAIAHFEWKSQITAYSPPKSEGQSDPAAVNPWLRGVTPDDCPGRVE